jgi:hypothetical protein
MDYNRSNVSQEKSDIMHDAFNRAGASKWSGDGTVRKVRTIFAVDGESRPDQTSTRFRYLQVHVSNANRKSNQVPWCEHHRAFFFASTGRCCATERSLAE